MKKLRKGFFIQKKVIIETYDALFKLAKKERLFSPILLNEIKEITKKTKIRPNKNQKFYFCNKCGSLITTSPRIKKKSIIMSCSVCGHIIRKSLI